MLARPSGLYLGLLGGSAAALATSLGLHVVWPNVRWHHEPLHSTLEAIGGLAAIAMAIVLFQRRKDPAGNKHAALSMGFLGMGLLELFHAMSPPGNAFVLLRNVASLVGSVGFGLVWFLGPKPIALRRRWLPWGVVAGALAFGTWAITFPEDIPEMIRNGAFTPTAVAPQSLACLLFLAATLRFLLDYRLTGKSEDHLFASLALMFGLAELVFMYSVPWDSLWWFWHLLRLMACLLVLAYIGRGYFAMISSLQDSLAQTQQAEMTLRRSEQQLRQVLDEREQMAQNLHDGSIQAIYATGLSLERCRRLITTAPNEVTRVLGEAIADLKVVIRDLRGYIVGQEPSVGNGRELEAALAALVQSMDRPHQLQFMLQVNPVAAARVTPEQAIHLVAVAREAMSNSLQHAAARTGRISLELHQDLVRLLVEDDGIGFKAPSVQERGHGLKNMEARARRLGGRLEVVSEQGRGTRVVFDLAQEPVHASA